MTMAIICSSVRCDEESSPEQSVLRQLLSNKRSQRNYQGMMCHRSMETHSNLTNSVKFWMNDELS